MDRRQMLKAAGGMTLGTILGGIAIPSYGKDFATGSTQKVSPKDRKKILVIGAHPDDPETGAGGTMCLLSEAGHEVVCVYVPRGEAGIEGKSEEEAAAIRVVESRNACEITGARNIFMSQVDGRTEINIDRYREMRELLQKEKPDVVLTHWPIDSHRDHAVCGLLVLDAWRRVDFHFDLYYFEVMSGTQTQMFTPTHWVDISSVRERKHKACNCHVSQGMEPLMRDWHEPMEKFRGIECRCDCAEAFMRHAEPGSIL